MADIQPIEAALNRLRDEIEALNGTDQEARERLGNLVHDIERTLGDPKTAAADEGSSERLKASILGFEVSHPRLAAVMNELVEKLGNIGI